MSEKGNDFIDGELFPILVPESYQSFFMLPDIRPESELWENIIAFQNLISQLRSTLENFRASIELFYYSDSASTDFMRKGDVLARETRDLMNGPRTKIDENLKQRAQMSDYGDYFRDGRR
ncbi:MAG: hypothetical protein H6880_08910 [Rhodobiaceae bacterium]|nr:hypothetical protein [Rhodobiaceae bacterium]